MGLRRRCRAAMLGHRRARRRSVSPRSVLASGHLHRWIDLIMDNMDFEYRYRGFKAPNLSIVRLIRTRRRTTPSRLPARCPVRAGD